MDNSESQSSDVFSEKDLTFSQMEVDDKLQVTLLRLKSTLCRDIKLESSRATFSLFFSNTLLDCASCINQKLEVIGIILEDPENLIGKLTEVLEDVITILQMLSSFLKNVLEAVTMSCACLKTFPIATGQILLSIFTHCKESEKLYGAQLKLVEEQLKNLFKACHELQIMYLMILEKHFIFDLSETQELDVLLNALEINLQIGEIVQALDLKTMAEQWKAYTMICERYSHYLIDKRMFQDATLCLCDMINNNVEMAACEQDNQKAVMRSLKVSNFAIKIVTKLCHIFKHAVDKRLNHIVKLLIDIQMKHPTVIENQKSLQFVQAMNANVLTTVDSIVLELLNDDIFIQCVVDYAERAKQSEYIVGYLLLIISIMKSLIQSAADDSALVKWTSDSRNNIFLCLLSAVRQGHTSLNLDYKFNISSNSYYCGLYEYLLIHTSLLALHCSSEQYGILEKNMLGALLGVDVYSAMFASDLWFSLASISPPNLTVNQLTYLCDTYKHLFPLPTFSKSPQQTYLSHIIVRLFKCLPRDDKLKVYQEFDLRCDMNRILWIVMKIKNLPDSIQRNAEGMVVDGLKTRLEEVLNSESVMERYIFNLVLQLKVAATCSFVVSGNIINEVVNAWLKVCPVTNRALQSDAYTQQNLWFVEYIDSLQDLTMVLLRNFQRNSQSLIKVLHVISKITSDCCIEIKLTLLNLIFKLSLCDIESNSHIVQKLLEDIYRNIFNENHYVFKTKLFELALQQTRNKNIEDLISKIIVENPDLEREWNDIQNRHKNIKPVKDQLKATDCIEYTHKCLPIVATIPLVTSKTNSVKFDSQISDNFELSDIDGLFNHESENVQPAIKKAKHNSFEVDSLLDKLDSHISDLSKLDVPVNVYRDRIIGLSERLRNIVESSV